MVKKRRRSLGSRRTEEPTEIVESLDAQFRIFGRRWGNRIVVIFCLGLGVPDIITHANFGEYRFTGLSGSGDSISHFSIHLRCRR